MKKIVMENFSIVASLMQTIKDYGSDETLKKLKNIEDPFYGEGMILVSLMAKGYSNTGRYHRVRQLIEIIIAREIEMNEVLFEEKNINHVNGEYVQSLIEKGLIENDIEGVLRVYNRQSSILLNKEDINDLSAVFKNYDIFNQEEIETFKKILNNYGYLKDNIATITNVDGEKLTIDLN